MTRYLNIDTFQNYSTGIVSRPFYHQIGNIIHAEAFFLMVKSHNRTALRYQESLKLCSDLPRLTSYKLPKNS